MRDSMNKRPATMGIVVLALVAVCGWAIWSFSKQQSGGLRTDRVGFFSVDDGKTWFADDLQKLPPFDKDGKPAVRAYIFTCGGGSPVCGYLERYTARARSLMMNAPKETPNPGMPPKPNAELMALGNGTKEVKRPGDATWTNMNGGGMAIAQFKCAGSEPPMPVLP